MMNNISDNEIKKIVLNNLRYISICTNTVPDGVGSVSELEQMIVDKVKGKVKDKTINKGLERETLLAIQELGIHYTVQQFEVISNNNKLHVRYTITDMYLADLLLKPNTVLMFAQSDKYLNVIVSKDTEKCTLPRNCLFVFHTEKGTRRLSTLKSKIAEYL